MEKEDGAENYAASIKFIKVILPNTYLTVFLLSRIHIQARMQLLNEVSYTKLQSLPLQLSECHDLPLLSFVLHDQRRYVEWVLISARSVEKCISVEKLSTLILTYRQSCKTSVNLQPATLSIFSAIPEAALHKNFAVNIARFFRTPILQNIR